MVTDCFECDASLQLVTWTCCETWIGNETGTEIDCKSDFVSRETSRSVSSEEEGGCVGGNEAGNVGVETGGEGNGNVFWVGVVSVHEGGGQVV